MKVGISLPAFTFSVRSLINYLVNESDGAIDMHYAYLFTLQGGVTTHTKACAVLGHKFADLREVKGRWRPWTAGAESRVRGWNWSERAGEAERMRVHAFTNTRGQKDSFRLWSYSRKSWINLDFLSLWSKFQSGGYWDAHIVACFPIPDSRTKSQRSKKMLTPMSLLAVWCMFFN